MRRAAAALMVSIALAACGAGHKAGHESTASRPEQVAALPRAQTHLAAPSHAPQLVSMRQTNGATWQTVVVRTDGTGDDGTFIGEWAGTHHRAFRLGPAALARLDRLVALAKRTPEKPYFGNPPPSIVDVIYVQRHVLQVAPGHTPRRLIPLTDILSGLIVQYS